MVQFGGGTYEKSTWKMIKTTQKSFSFAALTRCNETEWSNLQKDTSKTPTVSHHISNYPLSLEKSYARNRIFSNIKKSRNLFILLVNQCGGGGDLWTLKLIGWESKNFRHFESSIPPSPELNTSEFWSKGISTLIYQIRY